MRLSSDEKLVQQLKSGDQDALSELYRRYAKKLYVFLAHSMNSKNPEDLVHDIFVKVIESAPQFDSQRASFRSWVYAIARNLCIDHIRRDQKIRFVPLEGNVLPSGQAQAAPLKNQCCDGRQSVEFAYVQSRIFVCLNDCIARLEKDEDKQCLILYYLTGKVYQEIGDVFGKSISMIRKRIFAAREKVRFCLQRKGFDSDPGKNQRSSTFSKV